jgi:hypothetical protein
LIIDIGATTTWRTGAVKTIRNNSRYFVEA